MDSIFFKVRNGIILCPDDCRIETYLGFSFLVHDPSEEFNKCNFKPKLGLIQLF